MSKMIDETGNRYGRLTVLYKANTHISPSGKKIVYWHCKCDCGNEKDICGTSLRTGLTKSCGCIQKEKVSQINAKNLIGQRFGKLTVLEKTEKKSFSYYIQKCLCDCGNICEVSTNNLTMGKTTSCGCLAHKSKGEFKITSLLKENNIPFETEKIFDDCYIKKNGKMRFDFYVNNQYLIEFDGRQHFINRFSGQQESLEDIKERDEFKNLYCKKNNIPLIRIPYTHLKDLCIEDLLLETSNFILQ